MRRIPTWVWAAVVVAAAACSGGGETTDTNTPEDTIDKDRSGEFDTLTLDLSTDSDSEVEDLATVFDMDGSDGTDTADEPRWQPEDLFDTEYEDLSVIDMDWNGSSDIWEWEPGPEWCDNGCPADFNPMCGQDGNTYWNYCCLEVNEVEYQCAGECSDPEACPDAPDTCDPVCGMNDDGQQVSYTNAQVLDCMGAIPLYDSECCDGTYLGQDWVCADVDGTLESFLNEEVMVCINPALQVMYDIPQDAYGDYLFAVCDDCQCDLSETGEDTWLCGSDFNIYLDECALSCFAADDPVLAAVPVCDSGCGFMADECPCPPGIGGAAEADTPSGPGDTGARGVCGDDGATYSNSCDATYNGVQVLKDTWCDECEDLCKGENYSPLCCKLPGVDTGATYPNACVVENCSAEYDTANCFAGECCLSDEDCDDGNAGTVDSCSPVWFVCEHV